MQIHEERRLIGNAEIQFDCPSCDKSSATDALRFETRDKFLGLVTVWKTYETAVKCPQCEATCRTTTDLDELLSLRPEERASRFRVRIGLVEKFLVIVGWLFFFVGPVSLALFIAAWIMVPKAAKGWRRATMIGLPVSVVFTLLMIVPQFF
jgi:hypothetical protein